MNYEPYTLSDAIRIGSALRPQCFGELFEDGKSCAKGAAVEAITGEFCDGQAEWQRREALDEMLLERYADTLTRRMPCPACVATSHREHLDSLIVELNDYHGWTREQIADFVAEVEEQLGYVTLTVEQPVLETVLS